MVLPKTSRIGRYIKECPIETGGPDDDGASIYFGNDGGVEPGTLAARLVSGSLLTAKLQPDALIVRSTREADNIVVREYRFRHRYLAGQAYLSAALHHKGHKSAIIRAPQATSRPGINHRAWEAK
jgi:hypothetical protein